MKKRPIMDKRISKINLQAKVWNSMPYGVRRLLNLIRIMPRHLNWSLNQNGKRHLQEILLPYEDKFANCRCIVIGNGPSLNKMDLSLLRNEFTFGLNRIYLLFKDWGFETSFLVSINRFVLTQFSEDLRQLKMLKFFNWAYRDPYPADEKTAFLSPRPDYQANGNIYNGYYPLGGTVTNIAIEIAYFMGFSEVILIGVDHSFAENGLGGTAIVSQDPDQNHFSTDYFGPGVVWQLPNYHVMEKGYEIMKNLYNQSGRKILDATVNGKLNIFPKVEFEAHIKESKFANKKDSL